MAAATATLPLPELPDYLVATALSTISQQHKLPEVPILRLVYESRARQSFSEAELVDLLEEARTYNQQHGITGLLFYHNGHFIQFLEGGEDVLEPLYARIQKDRRHQQITMLYRAVQSQRVFTGWAMAFADPEPEEFYWLLDYWQAQRYRLLLPKIPITDPTLLVLLAEWRRDYPTTYLHT
ncbi:BLUF domain-containing protein [Hymenobacter sp. BT507]|uniref:BLUF domain-containing protein n=1 Tax=Hymenobacter citatus TaxID=2763506 RepID=A0ABR7MPA4_9BACT|nr:BLUF domain-containing protein [Hymenobacter citatus]MBC6612916.1 BLUF domain-containing protein [Hymenobacter citatus]